MDSSKLEEIEALTGSPPIISDISDLSEISELPETQENFSKAEHQIKMDAFDLSEILNERTEKLLTSSKSKRRSSSEKTFSPKIISNVPEKAIYCTESEYNDQLEMTVKLSKMENPTVAWLEQDNGANSGQDFKCIDAKIATDCDGISKLEPIHSDQSNSALFKIRCSKENAKQIRDEEFEEKIFTKTSFLAGKNMRLS